MDLRPVGVNGILAVLGDSISEQTGAQVFLLGSMHAGTEEAVYPEWKRKLMQTFLGSRRG